MGTMALEKHQIGSQETSTKVVKVHYFKRKALEEQKKIEQLQG